MKKRASMKIFSILTAALLLITGMSTTAYAGEDNEEKTSKGTYKVIYEVDPAYAHYYNLKNNNAKTYTDVKSTDQKITAFGVWLRAKEETSGNGDMDVKMTLLNDVTGTKDKKELHFSKGQVVSKRNNNQAFVDYNSGFGFANFADGTVIRIKVSPYNPPQEKELHSVEFKSHGNGGFEGKTRFENIPHGTTFGEAVPSASRPIPKADKGYIFKGWDIKGIPADDYKVEGNLHIYAEFEEATAEIQYAASDEEAGDVSLKKESLKAVNGTPKGVDAKAEAGHRFVNWTDEEGNVVSKEEVLIPEKTKDNVYVDQTYTANFKAVDKEEGGAGTGETDNNTPNNSDDNEKPEAPNTDAEKPGQNETPGTTPDIEMSGQNAQLTGGGNAAAVLENAVETMGTILTASAPRAQTPAAGRAVSDVNGTPVEQQEENEAAPAAKSIEDNKVPLADQIGKADSGWALINLMMTIAALLLSAFLLIKRRNSRVLVKAGSAVLAAASLIILALTQNFKLAMTFTDSWTIPMILLAGMEAALIVLAVKHAKEEK